MRSMAVRGQLGGLLRQEGVGPKVATIFVRAVIQAVIIFEDKTWVLLAAIERKVEGTHTGFLGRSLVSGRGGCYTGHGRRPGQKQCEKQRKCSQKLAKYGDVRHPPYIG